MPKDSGYVVYKPFKYGTLNVAAQDSQGGVSAGSKEGHSLSFVLCMLEDLWTRAIEDYLEVDRKNFRVREIWQQ